MKKQKVNIVLDMIGKDEESGVGTYTNISPSRTVKSFKPMTTKDSNNKADMNNNNNEDAIPFIPSLEVIRYQCHGESTYRNSIIFETHHSNNSSFF